jgi:hypothetical protein
LRKIGNKLFTFLDFDGGPWNNNNTAHAIKAFARLRRAIEGLSTPKRMEEYLTLLSVCQTCKYMGIDFLNFLRSGEKDTPIGIWNSVLAFPATDEGRISTGGRINRRVLFEKKNTCCKLLPIELFTSTV